MSGVVGLIVLMVIGVCVLAVVVIAFVGMSNRSSARAVLPDLAPGSRVVSTVPGDRTEVIGTLVRTDNDHAVIEVEGWRRFVPRDSLRPAFDRPPT